jgi:ribonuclease HI
VKGDYKMIKIYVDGSCSKNGSKNNFGGYGVVLTNDDKIVKMYKEGKKNTTNNEMEMKAVLTAIKLGTILSKETNQPIEIYSDSAYVVNTVNTWMYSWAANNWIKKSDKRPPENLELVKDIYNLMQFNKNITVLKIKGHAGEEFNEVADKLATSATAEEEQKYLKTLEGRK